MNNVLLQIFIMLFLGKVFGKNHFDADVLNNRFKVRRLLKFKLDLCREINNLNVKSVDGDVDNILNIHIRQALLISLIIIWNLEFNSTAFYASENLRIQYMHFRFVHEEICSDKDENLNDNDIIEYTASNPIRQYKLMKEMFVFAKDIYPEVLHAYLDSGIDEF